MARPASLRLRNRTAFLLAESMGGIVVLGPYITDTGSRVGVVYVGIMKREGNSECGVHVSRPDIRSVLD